MTKYINPFQAEYDTNGEPLSGGKLYFYEAGTTNPTPVYADEDLTTPLSNPLVADGDGRFATMYMQKILYKIVLTDANDVVIKTVDDYDFTNATLFNDIKVYATTTESGVVILATAADVITGTDDQKAVTPRAIADALVELRVSSPGYISGGVISNDAVTPDELIDVTAVVARSSDDTQDIEVDAVTDFDITDDANWASGSAPSLIDASIFLWAVYDATTPYYIFDDATGSNISVAKRLTGAFITDSSGDIILFTKYEQAGGAIRTEYTAEISVSITTDGNYNVSVPNGIEIEARGYYQATGAALGGQTAYIGRSASDLKVLCQYGVANTTEDAGDSFFQGTDNSEVYIDTNEVGTRTLLTKTYINERN